MVIFIIFSPNNLKVNFIYPNSKKSILNNRKYTLTYNTDTNLLQLDIGNFYNYKKVDFDLRNEILGEWILVGKNKYNLCFYIYIKGYNPYEIKQKYNMSKQNLRLAIEYILYTDKIFLQENKYLLNSSIIVKFFSSYFMFNSSEYYGLVSDYIKNL
ncbi:staygreen family protein [Paeniclostridium hominis]|uniref:staygreen family protein n=1 Tax=Paeniclostridium hominis TaxID=2764329 RepID=UPI00189A4A19